MEYTFKELETIIDFLDIIGSTSFVAGFKDGVQDYRNWLTGEKNVLTPDNGLVAHSCYAAGFEAAEECIGAWLCDHAETEEQLDGMGRALERMRALCRDGLVEAK